MNSSRFLLTLSLVLTLSACLTAEDRLQTSLELQLGQISQSERLTPAAKLKSSLQAIDTFVGAAVTTIEHLDKLSAYAELVYHSGLVFDFQFNEINLLSSKLDSYKESRVFRRFARFNQGKGYVDKGMALKGALDKVSRTSQSSDLPSSAKTTMKSLYLLGTAFEQLGDSVPLLGTALQGYGAAMTGLCDTMNTLARTGTVGRKQGLFSKAEQNLILGLPAPAGMNWYQRTALYRKGVPVVMLYAAEIGSDKYYLQTSKQYSTWKVLTDRQYNDAQAITAQYRVAYGKYPTGEKVWLYLTDKDERRFLTSKAMPIINLLVMKRRMKKILGGLAEVSDMNAFTQAENKLKFWSLGLGIPLGADRMDNLIRMYHVDNLQLLKTLRIVFYRLHPAIRTWLISNKQEPESFDIAKLMELYKRYRKGDFLPGIIKVHVLDKATGKPVPAQVRLTTGNKRQLSAQTTGEEVVFEPVYAGTCRLEVQAAGYEPKAGEFALNPIVKPVAGGSVHLVLLMDGSLTIRIRDAESGRSIDGATVLISGPLRRLVASQNGASVFTRLPPGTYALKIQATGYAPRNGSITVGVGREKHIAGSVQLMKLAEGKQVRDESVGKEEPTKEPEEYINVKVKNDATAAERQRLRAQIITARDQKIAELRRSMETDPRRVANKNAALAKVGKPRKLTCTKCGFDGMHWWFGDRWSCPGCEHCTMVADLDAGGGKTHRQVASEIVKEYEQKIAAVQTEADAKLKALR